VTPPRCPVCGGELERRPRPPREVTHGAVAAVVHGADQLVCPEGHHHEELVADLADRLTSAVREQIPGADRTRVRRRLRCGCCDAELTIPGRRTQRSVSTRVPGVGVVRLTFDLPMLRCPGCGREQLPAEVARDDVPASIRAVLG
jgi:uncharacterized protein with PIN domain